MTRPWLLALAAVAATGPWPGWEPTAGSLAALALALCFLARPAGRSWIAWAAVVAAVAVALWPAGRAPGPQRHGAALESHCSGMVRTAEALAAEPVLVRLLGAGGEAIDPALERAGRVVDGRTVFLADDRGQVIAWGGAGHALPPDLRILGQRQWGVAWSAGGADLWLREPLLQQGRLRGVVVVVDRSPLRARRIWGMQAVAGRSLEIGGNVAAAHLIPVPGSPGVEIPVAEPAATRAWAVPWRWLGWVLLAAAALWLAPRIAWLVVVVGSLAVVAVPGPAPAAAVGLMILAAGAAAGRLAHNLSPVAARILIAGTVLGALAAAVLAAPAAVFQWLPDFLLRPGWGGVWMVALAWLLSAWPRAAGAGPSLERRLRAAALLALLGLGAAAARVPVELGRAADPAAGVVLPRQAPDATALLPAPPGGSRLDDLAPVLAERWRLADWATPSRLVVRDDGGREISTWGDLKAAGPSVRLLRRWPVLGLEGWELELWTAAEPWSWLRDWGWRGEAARGGSGVTKFAVLTRSGEVAATLHPEIGGLDPQRAGELSHAGGGWAWLAIGEARRPARLWRRGPWLVAAIADLPDASDWVVRTAAAMLWAILGSLLAAPPRSSRQQLATFGGRLRLLVAAGVVVPLAILTLFLHQRITAQESRLVQARGLEALRAARYTAVHLGGGFAVDDELASWLAEGWGGEVALWDGIALAAVSRPDLVSTGALPPLPLPATFPGFLLGRDDSVVRRWRHRIVAAGPVELQGRRLLLHLYLRDTPRGGADLGAVDWLLTGACLSALFALVLTTRIETRLGSSLRDLVTLARKLVDGEPVAPPRRPPETDLAEVLDAVSSMNEQVQQRERTLRHQEELLRITLKTIEPAVFVLEPDGARRFANPAARRLEEEHGEVVLEELRAIADEAGATGSAARTVQPIPGRDLTWRVAAAAVPLPEGSPGIVAVVDDVTELVRADRARQLNQLARIVAHEVKNPLTPVRLWVQELQAARAADSPKLQSLLDEACREIAVQVGRLQETANSFSNLVALEEWRPEEVDLASVIAAVPSGSRILERRGIRFVREVPIPPPPAVVGDRLWLGRAVSNLIQNSIDALGESPGTVHMRLSEHPGWVVLEVEDSGGGVPEERLSELFAPHFSTTTAGSGLGLALVHQVVTRCQGRVEAVNGARGLCVRLELPIPPREGGPGRAHPGRR